MDIAARLEDVGRPAWIVLMILGFIFFWPLGLAVLAYLIWGRHMGCRRYGGHGRWHYVHEDELRDVARSWYRPSWGRSTTSGNRAFDEYRTETLHRLEEEQRDFRDFLDRLRFAKDKVEFDEFLAERRRRSDRPAGVGDNGPTVPPEA